MSCVLLLGITSSNVYAYENSNSNVNGLNSQVLQTELNTFKSDDINTLALTEGTKTKTFIYEIVSLGKKAIVNVELTGYYSQQDNHSEFNSAKFTTTDSSVAYATVNSFNGNTMSIRFITIMNGIKYYSFRTYSISIIETTKIP